MAATILQAIAAHARERVAAAEEETSLDALQAQCRALGRAGGAPFRAALERPGLSFLCEVKKASPSKGVIAPDFPYRDIARDYQAAGADAISCLTEPKWFLGSDQIFREIRGAVSLPMLRKDFTVDEYQLYQARLMGADCVLLICALLDTDELARYLGICEELGLDALAEAHDAGEIASAVSAGAKIIGVNNRNLKDFSVDFSNARPAAGSDPAGGALRGGKRRARPGGRIRPETDRRGRGARGRGAHARPGQGDHALRPAGGGPMTRIKICGLTRPEDVRYVNTAKPDWCGFILNFPSSRRNVTPEQARALRAGLDPDIRPVGVFVDRPVEEVAALLNSGVISVAQLHGREDNAYISVLRTLAPGCVVWRAFQLRSQADLAAADASGADLVLLDNGRGTGQTFDWSLAGSVHRPFLLAGGLTPESIPRAVAALRPYGLDLSSGVETDGSRTLPKYRRR